jgi:hypothetical protein
VLAEIRLPRRVERDVGPVVVEQVELDLLVARAIQERLIDRPRVGLTSVGSATPPVYWDLVAFSEVSQRSASRSFLPPDFQYARSESQNSRTPSS